MKLCSTVAQAGLELSQRSACHHTQLFFFFFLKTDLSPLFRLDCTAGKLLNLFTSTTNPSTTVTDVVSVPSYYVGAGNRTQDIRLARHCTRGAPPSSGLEVATVQRLERLLSPVPCAHSIQPAMCAALCILQIKRLEQPLQCHTRGVMCRSEPTMQA